MSGWLWGSASPAGAPQGDLPQTDFPQTDLPQTGLPQTDLPQTENRTQLNKDKQKKDKPKKEKQRKDQPIPPNPPQGAGWDRDPTAVTDTPVWNGKQTGGSGRLWGSTFPIPEHLRGSSACEPSLRPCKAPPGVREGKGLPPPERGSEGPWVACMENVSS